MAPLILQNDDAGDWQGKVVNHADLSALLFARREALRRPYMPRNSGKRRTASKQALLKALDEIDAAW